MDTMDSAFLQETANLCNQMLLDRSAPFCNPKDYTREQRWQDARDTMAECYRIIQMRKAGS